MSPALKPLWKPVACDGAPLCGWKWLGGSPVPCDGEAAGTVVPCEPGREGEAALPSERPAETATRVVGRESDLAGAAREGDWPQCDGAGEEARGAERPWGAASAARRAFRRCSFRSLRAFFSARRSSRFAGSSTALRAALVANGPGLGGALGPGLGRPPTGGSKVGKWDGEGRPRACFNTVVIFEGDLPRNIAEAITVVAREGDTGRLTFFFAFLSFFLLPRFPGLRLQLDTLPARRRRRFFLI